jgi:hypothetical protein
MRTPASQSLEVERSRSRFTLVFVTLTLLLVGNLSLGARTAVAQTVEMAQQMREAGKFAEQFFIKIRDERYKESFTNMDRKVQRLTEFGVTGVLRAKRNYLIGTLPDERYTFVTAQNPLQALSCVEAWDRRGSRKLYLSARLIRRSSAEGWKVLGFKVTSVPESGCPA